MKVGSINRSIMMRRTRLAYLVVLCDVLERHLSENRQSDVERYSFPKEQILMSSENQSTKAVDDRIIVTVSVCGMHRERMVATNLR